MNGGVTMKPTPIDVTVSYCDEGERAAAILERAFMHFLDAALAEAEREAGEGHAQ